MKTDARLRYTRKVLKESLLELLKTKPINKITVKELCELAGINRATFYKHYRDCPDLLEHIQDDFLAEYRESLEIEDWEDPSLLIQSIFNTIDQNIDVCDALSFHAKNPVLVKRMIDVAHEHCIDIWSQDMPQLSSRELEMLFTFLSSGLSAIILTYYKTCDRDLLIAFVTRQIHDCLEPYKL